MMDENKNLCFSCIHESVCELRRFIVEKWRYTTFISYCDGYKAYYYENKEVN